MAVIKSFCNDTSGATSIEYVCIACFVSIGIVAAVRTMGGNLRTLFFQPVASNLT